MSSVGTAREATSRLRRKSAKRDVDCFWPGSGVVCSVASLSVSFELEQCLGFGGGECWLTDVVEGDGFSILFGVYQLVLITFMSASRSFSRNGQALELERLVNIGRYALVY